MSLQWDQARRRTLDKRWTYLIGGLLVMSAGIPLVATSGVGGPVAADGPAAVPQEAVRIEVGDLKARLAKGDVVVIDTRSPDAFALSHIKGALSIPYTSLEARLKDLPKDKLIAAYCT